MPDIDLSKYQEFLIYYAPCINYVRTYLPDKPLLSFA